ncbi:MATE family efflux transporter [Helicovermis profundi]|uniref:Probable multidrug resistance protein NorM n=1 Tax=Helicovermis profundi TaxID=3065157 RepID=A0AAU9E294_9FIRM|nr:MATE family efflux transporter [Clostridia bacterium S502]
MSLNNKRDLILNGNINRMILILALPVMANNLIQTIYNLTDTYFVSKLGTTQIASIQFIWPVIFFMISIGMGVSIAGTSLISQYIGANELENAKKVTGQVISFSFLISIFLGVVGFFLTSPLLKFMGAKGEFLLYSTSFLKIIFIGSPTMFAMFSYNAIRSGLGDTVKPMIIGLLSVILNIILDPVLIFYFHMGVKGAAIATVISRAIFGLYAILTLFNQNNDFYISYKHLLIDKSLLSKIIKIGIPSSIGQSTTAVGFMVLNIFIVSFGEATLTAFAIGNRINSLILMPAMGIGSALATIVGQNLGADNPKRAKKAVFSSTVITTAFLVLGGMILIYFASPIVKLFSSDPSVISQGTYYLILVTLSIPLMGFFQILIGTFQGSGHTLSAMIMMMGRLWALRIPMIIIFKNYTNLGTNSVWYAMILSNLIICIVGYIIYKTGKWQRKKIK